ncbi:MAG: hypothetical protein K6G90_01455 [Clostridia bacterium]|nr:hypothetical protein [Clostridia bacterium]
MADKAAKKAAKAAKKDKKIEKKAAKKQAKLDKKNIGADIEQQTPVSENLDMPDVPVAKTKKEIAAERKAVKKEKKAVRREAFEHSAKYNKGQRILLSVLSLFIIIMIAVCTGLMIDSLSNLSKTAPDHVAVLSETKEKKGKTAESNATPATSAAAPAGTKSAAPAEAGSGASSDAGAVAGELNMTDKASVVEYYKAAHAKALANASKVTRVYDNSTNYNSVLEIGNNSTLAGIAQKLMGTFLKENTEALEFTGSDIGANFPPAGGNSNGLTADMISDFSCTEDGSNYIISLTIDSTEDNPDKGEKTGNLCTVVDEAGVKEAAGSMVKLEGMENHYIGATATATIDKATGNLIHLETDVPSYMIFAKASVMIVSVENARIGLEFQQKWDVEY